MKNLNSQVRLSSKKNAALKFRKELIRLFFITMLIPLMFVNCASKKQAVLTDKNINEISCRRIIPDRPDVNELIIRFNGDYLKAYYLLLDFRTPFEKKRDLKNGRLNGAVLVYLQAHSLRADTAYDLTSTLALNSKSGIVVVPVCDTPFGKDSQFRGDNGKDIVLMEVVKYVLNRNGVSLDGYVPITAEKISIVRKKKEDYGKTEKLIPSKLMVLGISHGGLLSRRLACNYPDLVTDIAQIGSAGFGGQGRIWFIMSAGWEAGIKGPWGLRIRGKVRQANDHEWGVFRGLAGDGLRGWSSCLFGNFHIFKTARWGQDAYDASDILNDTNFPASNLKSITVLFFKDDTLFEYTKQGGIADWKNITKTESDAFWEKHYPGNITSGTNLLLKVLPGNHLAPYAYPEVCVQTVLKHSGQLL